MLRGVFIKVLQSMLDTESREFSRDNVVEYLQKEHHEIANDTLYNYLEAFSTTFIMNKVYRYDIYGKNILKTLNKYYATDLGIKQIKTNNENINYSVALENLFYNDLLGEDCKVFISKKKKGEIDFIASKNNSFKYIQVCYDLSDESIRNREFSAFDEIENGEKYIISLTKKDYSTDTVKQIYLFDFLMNDDF